MFQVRQFLILSVISVFLGVWLFGGRLNADSQNDNTAQVRSPYSHVMRITAVLEFDGERIEVDDLIDCQTNYDGPAEGAVRAGFRISRGHLAYETRNRGFLKIDFQGNLCAAYPSIWADADDDIIVPPAWTPVMSWYDHKDPVYTRKGERYWSETALKNPNSRLKIIEQFSVSIPEQTEKAIEEAARQDAERNIWRHTEYRVQNRSLGVPKLPWYIKVPSEVWLEPPAYLQAPELRPADHEGLVELLTSLPRGDGLLLIGDPDEYDLTTAMRFTIADMITGRSGRINTISYHGIPQRNEPRWGMFLSEKSWQRAQIEKERIPFYDDWLPLQYKDGQVILRTDTPGVRHHSRDYNDWLKSEDRPMNFLNKPFLNGPWGRIRGIYIFDLQTRDLWVRG